VGQKTERAEMTRKKVFYEIPGMGAVSVRGGVEYQAGLTMDLYYPANSMGTPVPAVLFVIGYPDAGAEAMLGCKFKEMESYISWARLVAASGVAAITYTNREPAADLHAVLQHVRQNAASLGVDEKRIGLWAASGNVPLALDALMTEHLTCAALCYGYMLDLDGSTGVAEASKQWGFVNPGAGKSVGDFPQDVPLFIMRAGQDQFPHLNETIDAFTGKALARNLPITVVNHPTAPHAFDLFDDTEASREVIRQILGFLRFHLLGEASRVSTTAAT
jgi:dienelactone hydrolase